MNLSGKKLLEYKLFDTVSSDFYHWKKIGTIIKFQDTLGGENSISWVKWIKLVYKGQNINSEACLLFPERTIEKWITLRLTIEK